MSLINIHIFLERTLMSTKLVELSKAHLKDLLPWLFQNKLINRIGLKQDTECGLSV